MSADISECAKQMVGFLDPWNGPKLAFGQIQKISTNDLKSYIWNAGNYSHEQDFFSEKLNFCLCEKTTF